MPAACAQTMTAATIPWSVLSRRSRKTDDCSDVPVVGPVLVHSGHKAAVDLQHLSGKLPHVHEARVTGAEVVDRGAHTGSLEPLQRRDRRQQTAAAGTFEH